jgi:hypothetical protein
MDNLVPGKRYRLQLLFRLSPQFALDRGVCAVSVTTGRSATIAATFDPQSNMDWHQIARGAVIAAAFDPGRVQGGPTSDSAAFLRHDFVASEDTLFIALEGDPVLNAFTLEQLDGALESHTKIDEEHVVRLVDDAYFQLPQTTLGGSVAVSAWLQCGTIWDGTAGMTLFSSFQGTACGGSDACRNAVGGTLDRHGWLAVGNDVAAKRPNDLWAAGVIFDRGTSALFWEAAQDDWLMVTFTVSEQAMHVYAGGQLRGVGALEAPLPRMLRQSN